MRALPHSPHRIGAFAFGAVAALLALSSEALAGAGSEGVDELLRRIRATPTSLRLDDGLTSPLPLLAAYAEPMTSPWTYAARLGRRPWRCWERADAATSEYVMSPVMMQGMPAIGEAASMSSEPWCSGYGSALGGPAWPGRDAMLPWEGTTAGAVHELRAGWPLLPTPGERASWSGSENPRADSCALKPVGFLRFGAEADRFPLLGCDGSVHADALDHLSVMARPIGVARPTLPLPDEPDPTALRGEWLPSVKLMHPRLIWLMQRIADAFPGRTIYIVSGYRVGEHEGMHGEGRGLDINVMGVAKERVYKVCRRLRDTGCGYYPNHEFVHVDIRAAGSGGSYWIDVSRPGERSEYVSAWPGVEDGAGGSWAVSGDR